VPEVPFVICTEHSVLSHEADASDKAIMAGQRIKYAAIMLTLAKGL
jgi:hypothetical protein